jgi:esterase/lipase superfamily enzyme/Tfp pilus assembly protein PilF
MGVRPYLWAVTFGGFLCLSSALCAQSDDLDVLYQQVQELYQAGKLDEAAGVAKRALDLARDGGAPKAKLAAALDNLALIYKVQGHYGEAEKLYVQALNIHKQGITPNNPDLPAAINNLALLYVAQKRYVEAEPMFEDAIDKWSKIPNQSAVATGQNNLGLLYYHQGRYEEAEPHFKQALKIREEIPNQNDHAVAIVLNNLALVHEHQGRYEDAEAEYKRALDLAERLSPDNTLVGRIRENLGGLYKSLGKRGEAEQLLKRALAIKTKIFGPNSRYLAPLLAELGDFYRQQDCIESGKYFARARALGDRSAKEIRVVFATDRKPEEKGTGTVTFGSERSKALTYGTTLVTIAADTQAPSAQDAAASSGGKSGPAVAEAADARRLSQECYDIEDLQQLSLNANPSSDEDALIFIHGYNNTFDGAVRRAAQIAYDINFAGIPFAFCWPSQGAYGGYFKDAQTVELARLHLSDFIKHVINKVKPARIHFIAHSMGNEVLMGALEKLTGENPSFRPLLGQVINAAPDIGPDIYTALVKRITVGHQVAGLETESKPARKFTLYAAKSDWALRLSSWIWGNARAGLIYGKPLIGSGFDTIDITDGGPSVWFYFSQSHNIYADSPIVAGDMRRLVESGMRPPDKRTDAFKASQTADGTYWILRRASAAAR